MLPTFNFFLYSTQNKPQVISSSATVVVVGKQKRHQNT